MRSASSPARRHDLRRKWIFELIEAVRALQIHNAVTKALANSCLVSPEHRRGHSVWRDVLADQLNICEMLLAGLPHMLRVHVAGEPSDQWIEDSIRFSVGQSKGSDAGSSLVVGKLSEVLFVETLRRYIMTLPSNQTGWLAGARDPILGKALALLHADLGYSWTVSTLAKRVGLSRTRLAERFRHFLGLSPIAYLTEWRMKLGAEALQGTTKSIAEVALDVGYNSEARVQPRVQAHLPFSSGTIPPESQNCGTDPKEGRAWLTAKVERQGFFDYTRCRKRALLIWAPGKTRSRFAAPMVLLTNSPRTWR
jgi:AraC-like DNA-binding protein